LPAEAGHRLEHRHVRFARAVGLDALPAPDPQIVAGALGEERLDQRGLADARLPGDEDDLARAVPDVAQPRVKRRQLLVAPNECGSRRPHGREWEGARIAPRGTMRGGREAVAAPVHGLDVARRMRVVAESLAQLAHAALEHRVAN